MTWRERISSSSQLTGLKTWSFKRAESCFSRARRGNRIRCCISRLQSEVNTLKLAEQKLRNRQNHQHAPYNHRIDCAHVVNKLQVFHCNQNAAIRFLDSIISVHAAMLTRWSPCCKNSSGTSKPAHRRWMRVSCARHCREPLIKKNIKN